MGVYVFSKRALRKWLSEDRTDFGTHVVPAMLDGGARVFGYDFDGYWQDVGTIQSYWEANMALLDDAPELDLYDKEWLIHTRSEERAPAKIGPTAQVHRSMVSHGCVINGTVVNSVLSPGVRVEVGAVVRDSIVMFDTDDPVGRGGRPRDPRQGGRRRPGLHRGRWAGPGHAESPGAGQAEHGITVVGKRTVIPRGTRLGRNVKVGYDVKTSDFRQRVVKTGGTVEPSEPRTRPSRSRSAGGAPVMGAGPTASRNGHDKRDAVPTSGGRR